MITGTKPKCTCFWKIISFCSFPKKEIEKKRGELKLSSQKAKSKEVGFQKGYEEIAERC